MPDRKRITTCLSLSLTLFLVPAAATATTTKVTTLGNAGVWRALEKFEPFADPQRECAIHTTGLDANTARRKQPRLRIYPNQGRFIVDPSFNLTQAISALGLILERRNDGRSAFPQFLPKNELQYGLRVDDGEIVSRAAPPDFEPWAAQREMPDFDAFLDAMARGKTLYVSWKLDRAAESFDFNLEGFAAMLALTRKTCPAKPAASGAQPRTDAGAEGDGVQR